jgi:hypothetical protein
VIWKSGAEPQALVQTNGGVVGIDLQRIPDAGRLGGQSREYGCAMSLTSCVRPRHEIPEASPPARSNEAADGKWPTLSTTEGDEGSVFDPPQDDDGAKVLVATAAFDPSCNPGLIRTAVSLSSCHVLRELRHWL